jgi:predicted LPLAT superfamily acyltransferase
MTQKWEGKSKGPVLGYRIFLFIIRVTHIRIAYFILYFVAFFYFAFASSRKHVYYYFKNILGYRGLKLHVSAYRNYYIFGQTLMDKFAVLSGIKKPLNVTYDGRHHLEELAKSGKGAIFVSAHVGNWELAGNMLSHLNTKFNVLMFTNEKESIKNLEEKKLSEKKLNVIPVDNKDMTHIIALHQAFKNGEILVTHADRYVAGAQVKEMDFFGKKADFPVGPFYLAAKFGVPICFIGAVKTGVHSCYVFANEPIRVEKVRGEAEVQKKVQELMELNVKAMESLVKRFPLQWFNYYQFWKY